MTHRKPLEFKREKIKNRKKTEEKPRVKTEDFRIEINLLTPGITDDWILAWYF